MIVVALGAVLLQAAAPFAAEDIGAAAQDLWPCK
jgi:hypothetical protein